MSPAKGPFCAGGPFETPASLVPPVDLGSVDAGQVSTARDQFGSTSPHRAYNCAVRSRTSVAFLRRSPMETYQPSPSGDPERPAPPFGSSEQKARVVAAAFIKMPCLSRVRESAPLNRVAPATGYRLLWEIRHLSADIPRSVPPPRPSLDTGLRVAQPEASTGR